MGGIVDRRHIGRVLVGTAALLCLLVFLGHSTSSGQSPTELRLSGARAQTGQLSELEPSSHQSPQRRSHVQPFGSPQQPRSNEQALRPRLQHLRPAKQSFRPARQSLRIAQARAANDNKQVQHTNRPERVKPKVKIPPFQMQNGRFPLLPQLPKELADPQRRPEVERDYRRFVKRTIDPEVTLDLLVGRPRILEFHQTPTRVYLAQESVASYNVISDKEIAIVGVSTGRTVLTIWVDDPDKPGQQRVLSYLLRVRQDSGYKVRLEAVFKALEGEINRDFSDSFVKLSLIGDQVVVRGQAKDVIEAAQILRIVGEHAPPSRRKARKEQPESLSVSQTAFSPDGLASRELGFTLDRLSAVAGLEGNTNVINLLTIPGEQQVMLRVTVAEVNRSALRSLGTSMRVQGSGTAMLDSSFPPRVGDLANATLMVLEGGSLSVTRGDLRLAVDALKQHNLARTLAEPNLVTLHGRPARFQAGGQFPVPSARVGFGAAAQGVEFVPFGVQLQFVPFIIDRDKIRLNIAANVSTREDTLATDVSGSNVPGLNSRNFQNTVELREGQTLAVAGLIQTNFGANSSRLPGLGDLPIIGRLFKSDSTSSDEQELVILISPRLVHPVDASDNQPLPGSDMIEPSDVEFYLKGHIEGRRSEGFRSPARTDWARLRRFRKCEDAFIIGPSGHSYGRPSSASEGHMRWQNNTTNATRPQTNGRSAQVSLND